MSAPPQFVAKPIGQCILRKRAQPAIIGSPRTRPFARQPCCFARKSGSNAQGDNPSFFYPPLMRARDAHVFPIFGHRAACNLNSLGLQDARNLLVGKGPRSVLFVDKFLDSAFEDEQGSVSAFRSLNALAEKIP